MRMFRELIFIIFVIFVHDSSCVFEILYDIGKKVWKLNSLIDKADLILMQGAKKFMKYSPNQELKDHMNIIHRKLEILENSMEPDSTKNLMRMMRSNAILFSCLDKMELFVASINDDYEKFSDYVYGSELEKLETFIILNIESKIQMLRILMMDTKELQPSNKNLAEAIAAYVMVHNENICGGPQLFTEGLVHLFRMAVLTEIKAFVILSVANKYHYSKDEDWMAMNNLSRIEFKRYFSYYVYIIEQHLNSIEGSYLRACDPINGDWILNENFYELKNTVKATIFQYNFELCWSETCESTWRGKLQKCNVKNYNERSGCVNTSTECTNLGIVQACLLKNNPDTFQYINSTELGLLGENFDCPRVKGYIIDDPKYHTCSCDCYEDHNKISLFIIESRWELNMVITGLRFIRKNNTLYIQPKEGKLMANGYIDPNSESWITIPDNIEMIEPSRIYFINKWNKFFFLDDLRLPAYYCLTGIQFYYSKRGIISGFGLNIFGTPFNYTTGHLNTSIEIQRFDETEASGNRLIFKPINPIQKTLYQRISSYPKSVALERSHLMDDFGQSTLPLFDAIPITTNPSSALGGVGIFHKGAKDSAGFISLRIYGIRYKEYFIDFMANMMVNNSVSFD